MLNINIKQGDTVAFVLTRKNAQGELIDGETQNFRAQVKSSAGKVFGTFEIVKTSLGTYQFTIPPTSTVSWAVGTLFFDVKYRDGDVVSSTDTCSITVEKGFTQWTP